MFHALWSSIRNGLRTSAGSLYHILIVALSGGIAFLLPAGAKQVLAIWPRVEHDKLSLVALEMTTAILLMVGFNYLHRSIRDRRLAAVANGAGLVAFFPRRARGAQSRIKALKEEQGTGRTMMVIGSSGYSSFVDHMGDLSSVLEKCLGAHVLLVNPYSPEASARIQAIHHPDIRLNAFREEVRQSIEYLKRLRTIGKAVKLKLYADPPLVKMVILGDYLWLQHYHSDLNVQAMPEYVLRHNRKDHGLYTLYAHYFMQRWDSPEIPEYDFDTDELVYRSRNGQELRRERFGEESISTDVQSLADALEPNREPAQLV